MRNAISIGIAIFTNFPLCNFFSPFSIYQRIKRGHGDIKGLWNNLPLII
jgi:hypothetical protein